MQQFLKQRGWFLVLVIALAVLTFFGRGGGDNLNTGTDTPISTILTDAKAGRIQRIEMQEGSSAIDVIYRDNPGSKVRSHLEPNQHVTSLLLESGVTPDAVEVHILPKSFSQKVLDTFIFLLPTILIMIFFYFYLRQAKKPQS